MVDEVGDEEQRRLDSLSRLAYGLAHDFNNLLGVVLMYNSLLARRSTESETAAQLAEVRAVTEQAIDLTRELLNFAGRTVRSPALVDVNELVSASVDAREGQADRSVDVELLLHPRPLWVDVDAAQIEHVIGRLVANARDAMPDGGTVTIATAPGGVMAAADEVSIEVGDTGEGMTDEVLSKALEPFFTTRPHRIGRGLGLSTAYGLVRQNGGSLTIASTLGAGTTVTIRFRLATSGGPAGSVLASSNP